VTNIAHAPPPFELVAPSTLTLFSGNPVKAERSRTGNYQHDDVAENAGPVLEEAWPRFAEARCTRRLAL
jgi:hypothetical protein